MPKFKVGDVIQSIANTHHKHTILNSYNEEYDLIRYDGMKNTFSIIYTDSEYELDPIFVKKRQWEDEISSICSEESHV